jgi:hypothetical protein
VRDFVIWRQRREKEIEGECEVVTDRIEEKGEGVNCCLQEASRKMGGARVEGLAE